MTVPSYHSHHIVQGSIWSYCPRSPPEKPIDIANPTLRAIDLSIPPPPYILCEERRLSRSNSRDQFSIATSPSSVDHNMNEMQELVSSIASLPLNLPGSPKKDDPGIPSIQFTLPDPEDGSHAIADVDFSSGQSGDEVQPTPPDSERKLSKLASEAQLYLQSESRGDLGLKSNDSLLFIPRHEDEDYNPTLPSESEAESTPTNSPTHHAMPEDALESKTICPSFGLHSPHLLMSNSVETEDVEELLRQLQNSTNIKFEEDTICLDPDIIDLTIVPPPSVDDVDFCCVTPDDTKSLLDQETGQRSEYYTKEKDPPVLNESEEDGIEFSVASDTTTQNPLSTSEDDLSAYIIPPPPPSSSKTVEEQNRVLVRFRQAAEEIQRMMAQGNDNLSGTKYSDTMNSVSKFCTIPRRHEEVHRPTLASLVTTPRENLHSVTQASQETDAHRPSIASLITTPVRETYHGKIMTQLSLEAQPNGRGTVDSETGVSWRPQPPPRVKRNSIVAAEAEATNSSLSTSKYKEQTSQNDSRVNGHAIEETCETQESHGEHTGPITNGYHNGHSKNNFYNGFPESGTVNGHDDEFYMNGEYNSYESSEFQPAIISAPSECDACAGIKNKLTNGCVCKKGNRFLSYHQSLPRKSMGTKLKIANGSLLENGLDISNGKSPFHAAQREIADMIENLDIACKTRKQECAECPSKTPPGDTKLVKVRDTLIFESRQFVTASKLFVKSITESSDKMEEHLTTCIALLDRIFAVSELVVMEMTLPTQINSLGEKLKEMAVSYSRTVQAAQLASAGAIPNSNMAGLMHQATSLATSLTVLMRTLRTFGSP